MGINRLNSPELPDIADGGRTGNGDDVRRLLSRFARNLAHDVRNSLSTMNSALYLLKQTAANPEATEFVTLIENEIRSANATLTGYTYLDPARVPRERQSLDVAATLGALIDRMDPQRSVNWNLDLQPDPCVIECAAEAVSHAFEQILANAIEATRLQGCVTVRSRATAAGWSFEISDSGPGIPAELLETALDPLVTTRPERLGLGLTICRTIVNSHGGTLRIGNAVDSGAIVRFDLPRPSGYAMIHDA